MDVDPAVGSVRALAAGSLAGRSPAALSWDPIGRQAIVAVAHGSGAELVRIDPGSGQERSVGRFTDPVIAIEIDDLGDLIALTGGPNGGCWSMPRNGGLPVLRVPLPYATALGAPKGSSYVWIARQPPLGGTTITSIDVRSGRVLVPDVAVTGLGTARITGIFDLPTGAIRQALTDDLGRIHVFEFLTTLRTIAVSPALAAGATTDLLVTGSIDAIVLGDRRAPSVHRVPIFGAAPNAVQLAGPLPGDPIDFDLVDSRAAGHFGIDCGHAFAGSSLSVSPGLSADYAVVGAAPSALALAVFGASEQLAGPIPLPTPLPGGCPLLVAPDVVIGPIVTDANGSARLTFPVPSSLPRGFAIYAQWVFPRTTGAVTTAGSHLHFEP